MGSALPPFQEGLWVVQAPLREGLPAYPTPGLGSALGGHHSESQYLPVWFYQFFTPAPRHFSLLPLAQADFYAAPELASTVPKACQVLRGCFLVSSAAVTGQRLRCPEAPAPPRGPSVPWFLGFAVAIQTSTNNPSFSCHLEALALVFPGAGQSLCPEGWDMGQSPLAVPCSCSTDSRGWSSESCSSPEAWVLFVNPFLVNTT